jgi:hypothetical protein
MLIPAFEYRKRLSELLRDGYTGAESLTVAFNIVRLARFTGEEQKIVAFEDKAHYYHLVTEE